MADYNLKAVLSNMGKKRMNAALFKGKKESTLLVTQNKASDQQIKKIEKDQGESERLFKGICFWDEPTGLLVFRVKKDSPPPSWTTEVKAVLRDNHCGDFKFEFRTAAPNEPDEVTGEQTEEQPARTGTEQQTPSQTQTETQPQGDAAAKAKWEKVKAAVTPHIKTTIASDPGKKDAIAKLYAEAMGHEKAAKFAEAIKSFEGIVAVIKAAPGGAPQSTQASKPQEKPKSPAGDTAAFTARLKALMPDVVKARADKAPDAEAAVGKVAAAGNLVKSGDLAGANALLDEVEQFLARVKAGTGGESEAEDVEETQPTEQAEQLRRKVTEADWTMALERIEPNYLTVMQGVPAEGTRLRALMEKAHLEADQEKYGEAIKTLYDLEALLKHGGASETDAIAVGLVNYRKALLAFAEARSQIASRIEALKAAIPVTLPEEQELADAVGKYLNAWNDTLSGVIDKAINTAKDERAPLNNATRAAVQDYLADLEANELIAHAESPPFGPVGIRAAMGPALRRIETAMEKL